MTLKVMLVEDRAADRKLARIVLGKMDLDLDIVEAINGDIALSLLEQGYTPDIVLLDLNLPRPPAGGLGVLEKIKSSEKYKHIVVVILTTSTTEKDRVKAIRDNHANAYVVKPVDIKDFRVALESLGDFWGNHNVYHSLG